MFSLIKGDWPYVFAWGGFFPGESGTLARKIGSHDPRYAHEELSKFYPPCILIFDKRRPRPPLNPDDMVPPDKIVEFQGVMALDYDKIYPEIANLIDSDSRFSIYKLKPLPPAKRWTAFSGRISPWPIPDSTASSQPRTAR